MDEHLVIIGGTSLLRSSVFTAYFKEIVETPKGNVAIYRHPNRPIIFLQRHAANPDVEYSLPSMINYAAIGAALEQLGVKRVISLTSVGSLKDTIPVGTFLVADDYFCPFKLFHFYTDKRAHFVPSLNTSLRPEVIRIMSEAKMEFVDGGVYVNSLGPRFETKAEIRWYKTVGDVIGMTGANETSILQELGIDTVLITMVDNMANGIQSSAELTLERFKEAVKQNEARVEQLVSLLLKHFA